VGDTGSVDKKRGVVGSRSVCSVYRSDRSLFQPKVSSLSGGVVQSQSVLYLPLLTDAWYEYRCTRIGIYNKYLDDHQAKLGLRVKKGGRDFP
jgi:hypothetical protein